MTGNLPLAPYVILRSARRVGGSRISSQFTHSGSEKDMADLDAARTKLHTALKSMLRRHHKMDAHLHNTDREVPQD